MNATKGENNEKTRMGGLPFYIHALRHRVNHCWLFAKVVGGV